MLQSVRRVRNECTERKRSKDVRLSASQPDSLLFRARQVHQALSAPPSQRAGKFEIANATIAARQVSGDFVVSFEQDGYRYCALGDLMGKGLPAAMWLTHVIDLLRRACECGGSLPEVMSELNREVHRSRVGVPLTSLFLARLEQENASLTYSCAGCPPAFLLNNDGVIRTLHEGGPILGALWNAKYAAARIEFAPKDTLLVVSDGMIEVHSGEDFELRPDRVIEYLRKVHGSSASEIVQGLVARMAAAREVVSDDLSLLAIQLSA